MIIGRQAKNSMTVSRALCVLELMLCLLLATFSAHAQSVAGRWAASGKASENGEQQKAVLDFVYSCGLLPHRSLRLKKRLPVIQALSQARIALLLR